MATPTDAVTALTLCDLQYRYGYALDSRDAEALRAVFDPDVIYRVFPPDADAPAREIRGRGAMGTMVTAMAQRYTRTMHAMNNPTNLVDGDRASGTINCVAHHLIMDDGPPRTFVAYIRYDDEFRRGSDRAWRILRRDVRFLWTEEGAPPLEWATAVERGRLS